jgi:hypothetical protein
MVENGLGPRLLCAVFGFVPKTPPGEGAVRLVYLLKQGTFYPFAPTGPTSATTNSNFACDRFSKPTSHREGPLALDGPVERAGQLDHDELENWNRRQVRRSLRVVQVKLGQTAQRSWVQRSRRKLAVAEGCDRVMVESLSQLDLRTENPHCPGSPSSHSAGTNHSGRPATPRAVSLEPFVDHVVVETAGPLTDGSCLRAPPPRQTPRR